MLGPGGAQASMGPEDSQPMTGEAAAAEVPEGAAELGDTESAESAEVPDATDSAESEEANPADATKTKEASSSGVAAKAEKAEKETEHDGATGFAKEGTLIWLGPAGLTLLSFDRANFLPMYHWSFGLGGFRTWKSGFAGALALGADHTPIAWGKAGHLFHIEPQIRLGYARPRWFVYGLLSPGLAILNLDFSVFGVSGSGSKLTIMGFSGRGGVGVMGLVWKGLMLGVDFVGGVDLLRREEMPNVSTYETVTIPIYPLQFRMLVGHKF